MADSSTTNDKFLKETSFNKAVVKIKKAIDYSAIEYDIDNTNMRIGLKKKNDTDFVYTPMLGKAGTSVTDVHEDETTGELVVVLSDENVTNSLASYGGPATIDTVASSVTTLDMAPNVFYKLGEVSQLTVTLANPSDITVTNEYMLEFQTGASGAIVVFDRAISWVGGTPSYAPNMIYQISILNNVGVAVGVSTVTV